MNEYSVILITVDALRADRCGFLGHTRATTPVLDALAEDSYVYEAAYSTGPCTPESFPGILAGLLSPDVVYKSDLLFKALPTDTETVATRCRARDYETVATITNRHLTAARNFDTGFSSFQNLRASREAQAPGNQPAIDDGGAESLLSRLKTRIKWRVKDPQRPNIYMLPYMLHRTSQLRSGWPTTRAETTLGAFVDDLAAADGPVFAWTHLMDLHCPIHPDTVASSPIGPASRWRTLLADSYRFANLPTERYAAVYDSAIRYVDAQIGALVETLKRDGQWEDTILIVTSDHGEALGENHMYGHPRNYFFDELLHVPLLVRVPCGDGGRVKRPFSLANLPDLVTELIDRGESPHLADESAAGSMIVADAINWPGHTVSARLGGCKYTEHFGEEINSHWIKYRGENPYIGGFVEGECDAGTVAELRDAARKHRVDPKDIKPLRGDLSAAARAQLADLGYVADQDRD